MISIIKHNSSDILKPRRLFFKIKLYLPYYQENVSVEH